MIEKSTTSLYLFEMQKFFEDIYYHLVSSLWHHMQGLPKDKLLYVNTAKGQRGLQFSVFNHEIIIVLISTACTMPLRFLQVELINHANFSTIYYVYYGKL